MKKLFFVWRKKTSQTGIKLFFALLLLTFCFLILTISRLPPEIPLFYSRPWGEEQLASKYFLWFLLIGLSICALIDIILATLVSEKFPLLAQILIWTGVLILLMGSLTIIKIVILVL